MNGFAIPPFLADIDIETIIKFLLVAGFFVMWILSGLARFVKSAMQSQQPTKNPEQGGPNTMEAKIEDLLQRTGQRPRGQSDHGAPVARAKTVHEPAYIEDGIEIVDELPSGKGVAQHVEEYLGSSRLGERVSEANLKTEAHLHQAFDHQLGRLLPSQKIQNAVDTPQTSTSKGKEGEDDDVMPDLAAVGSVSKLLENANGLRQAIILREILERPVHRW